MQQFNTRSFWKSEVLQIILQDTKHEAKSRVRREGDIDQVKLDNK